MAELEKSKNVYQVFESIAGGYDQANIRISLGLQSYWKKILIHHMAKRAPAGSRVLDVCCGTGDITLALSRKRPDLLVTGLDFSPAMLKEAEEKGRGRAGISWKQGDAMQLPFDDSTFSAVCISFGLRNTEDYAQVLREMKRVLKRGGRLYVLDSFVPDSRLVRPFYELYFRFVMPVIGGGRSYRQEYQWLWESTKKFLRKGELQKLLSQTGLVRTGTKSLMCGACVLLWGQKNI